jgi:hypothetical protein
MDGTAGSEPGPARASDPCQATVILRGLERDGVLTGTVRSVMPPHVGYELTRWAGIAHLSHIDAAREVYDARPDTSSG